MLPFLIDMAGNAANFYDTIDRWDGINHFVNWAILVTGFGLVLLHFHLGRVVTAGLAVGFGAVTAILWEFLEYVTFIRPTRPSSRPPTRTRSAISPLTVTALWPPTKTR